MGIMPIHQRIAELWMIQNKRFLTEEEQTEFIQCMKQNITLCWEDAYLKNKSLMASLVGDVDWQHEICIDIENKKYE